VQYRYIINCVLKGTRTLVKRAKDQYFSRLFSAIFLPLLLPKNIAVQHHRTFRKALLITLLHSWVQSPDLDKPHDPPFPPPAIPKLVIHTLIYDHLSRPVPSHRRDDILGHSPHPSTLLPSARVGCGGVLTLVAGPGTSQLILYCIPITSPSVAPSTIADAHAGDSCLACAGSSYHHTICCKKVLDSTFPSTFFIFELVNPR
jgi:hypothetical protein